MAGSPVSDIVIGYVEEVRTYIPALRKGLAALRENPEQPELVEEMHRMVHTIKGASLMVGIPGLSHIALQMENALADLLSGDLSVTVQLLDTMKDTISRFQAYCDGLTGDGVQPREMLRETVLAYRRVRELPPDDDEAELAPLLHEIPAFEAGTGAAADGDETGADDLEREMAALAAEEASPSPPETPPPSAEPPEILPELLESFYEEAREHLDELDSSLNILESQVTEPAEMTPDQKEIVRKIRRAVHTLKGASAVIGLSTIAAWGHIFEDFLDWLYESARSITPEMIAMLMDGGDLMARLVASPQMSQDTRSQALQAQFTGIMGAPETGAPSAEPSPAPGGVPAETAPPAPTATVLPEPEPGHPDFFTRQTQTLRVSTERVDELVNLTGEVMIVSGAFEQQMNLFMEATRELDVARNRLREIARDMEVGYEVKALGRLGTGAGGPAAAATAYEDFDSLELDRYSRLSMIIRTLNESVIDVGALFTRLSTLHSDFDGHLNRQRVLMSDLQDKMMQIRMLPMSTLSNKLRRTVREVGKVLGKKLRLVIEGEEIELDRLIWDRLTDPLMHLLRNAADHGIEPPDVRRRINKPAVATLRLAASREGNQVVIRITDDGAGLNYRAITRKARDAGLMGEDEEMAEEELAALIFRPGFSTRETISEVSGRGVGMDVVRENIQSIKGSVRVNSWKERGTRFTIRIPLTLAAIRALLFRLEDRTFAIALNEIREIIRVEPRNLIRRPKRAIRAGEDLIPLHSLKTLLHIDTGKSESLSPIVLVVDAGGRREALEIDALVGQREIVIKSTGSHLRYVRGISGVTIVGDGSVVPILNVPELIGVETAITPRPRVIPAEEAEPAPVAERPPTILVVDDSVSIRQVVSQLLEGQGWQIRTARDGLDALEKLREEQPDLIVLDIEMPRMNGYEFLSALSADPDYRRIPVVMLTSRATAKHRDRAIALGARGFAIKPFNDNEFIDMILSLIV